MPSICSENKSKYGPIYFQWMANSSKQSFLSGMDIDAITKAATHRDVLARPTKVQKTRAVGDPQTQASSFNSPPEQVDFLPSSSAEALTGVLDPFSSIEAFQRVFEAEMMLKGKVWLLDESDQVIVVLWNACSPEACRILTTTFCTTTFYKSDVTHNVQGSCAECPIFKGMGSSQTQSNCPHLAFRQVALSAAQTPDSALSRPFESFLRDSFNATSPISELLRTETKSQYFILCPKLRAHQGGLVTRHGLVTIEMSKQSGETLLSCSNTHCKRRIDRRPAKRPQDFCPHFETLWRCSSIMTELQGTMTCGSLMIEPGTLESESDSDPEDAGFENNDESCSHDREFVLGGDDGGQHDDDSSENWKTSVRFNVTSGAWEPDTSFACAQIPLEPTEHTRQWSEHRTRGFDLMTCASGLLKWTNGVLEGTRPCVPEHPQQCPVCGNSEFEVTDAGHFLVRTYIGCVRRSRQSLRCANLGELPLPICSVRSYLSIMASACRETVHWDPATEAIHIVPEQPDHGGKQIIEEIRTVLLIFYFSWL